MPSKIGRGLEGTYWTKEHLVPHLVLMACLAVIIWGVFSIWGPKFKPLTTEYHLVLCQVGDDQLTRLVADGWVVEKLGTATEAGIPVLLRRTK
jgi:hypothetical protein